MSKISKEMGMRANQFASNSSEVIATIWAFEQPIIVKDETNPKSYEATLLITQMKENSGFVQVRRFNTKSR